MTMLHMYKSWTDAVEHDKMAGFCFHDMSSAFHIVDNELLKGKFSLYESDEHTFMWKQS
jgi:hypothetical protein